MQHRHGMQRPVCPTCDHIVYFEPKVAIAVLIQQGDCILLIRRAHDPFKDYWALPAGFMEWNEDPMAAGCREVLEETGLIVTVENLLDVFHTPDDGGIANIVIVYTASISSGNLQASDDAVEAKWFDRAHLPEHIAFLPTRTIVRRWLANELTL
ncbi:MAG: NUDIX domain-containing protein [Anaerolineae bacterium]|nr:NUDIX domain-containing protein [Anaerolineae bacterium]